MFSKKLGSSMLQDLTANSSSMRLMKMTENDSISDDKSDASDCSFSELDKNFAPLVDSNRVMQQILNVS